MLMVQHSMKNVLSGHYKLGGGVKAVVKKV